MINRMGQAEQGIDRRSLLARGGVVAAGALGATVASVAAAAPASAVGLGFNPITPYRSYDSRNDPAGKITFGAFFGLQLISDENGMIVIPLAAQAQAVTFNLTVTQTVSFGYLGLVPGNTPPPFKVSNINWVASGLDLANGGTTAIAFDADGKEGSVRVYCDGAPDTGTHLILDVTGYFSA